MPKKPIKFKILVVTATLLFAWPSASGFGFEWDGKIKSLVQLLKSSDETERLVAVQGLAPVDASVADPHLRPMLQDPSVAVRTAAAIILAKHFDTSIAKEVALWLEEDDLTLKMTAADVLGQLRIPAYLQTLIRTLSDPDFTVRIHATQAVGAFGGKAALVPLLGRLEDEKAEVRAIAVNQLANLGFSGSALSLIALFSDPSQEVQLAAINAVGRLGNSKVAPALLRMLKANNEELRVAAMTALGHLQVGEAVPSLRAEVERGSDAISAKASIAIAHICSENSKDAQDTLRWLLTHSRLTSKPTLWKEAALTAGANAVSTLLALGSDTRVPKEMLVAVLGRQRDERVTTMLLAELEAGNISLRTNLEALSEARDPRTLTALLARLTDPLFREKALVLQFLGPQLEPGSIAEDVLADLTRHSNPVVQDLAIGHLVAIGSKRVLPDLLRRIRSAETSEQKIAAILAVGEVSDTASIETLIALLKSPKSAIAASAAFALEQTAARQGRGETSLFSSDQQDTIARMAERRDSAALSALRVAAALAHDGDEKWISRLKHGLASQSLTTRILTIGALGATGRASAIPHLLAMPQNSGGEIAAIASALGAMPRVAENDAEPQAKQIQQWLQKHAQSSNERVASAALWALGQRDELRPLVQKQTQSPLAMVAINATAAASLSPRAGDAAWLLPLLSQRDVFVRNNAAIGLGRWLANNARDSQSVVDALAKCAQDDTSWLVRLACLRGLVVSKNLQVPKIRVDQDRDSKVRDELRKWLRQPPTARPTRNEWRIFHVLAPDTREPVKQQPCYLFTSDGLVVAYTSNLLGEIREEHIPAGEVRLIFTSDKPEFD